MKLIVFPILKFDGIVCEGYAVCQCAKIYDLILFQVLKFRVITVRLNILTLRGFGGPESNQFIDEVPASISEWSLY